MRVDGQQVNFFGFFGEQEKSFKEAKVTKEQGGFGIFGGFGQAKYTIDAGSGDDTISVKKTGADAYEVNVNGQKFTLTKEEMKNLTIKGGSGNDKITIDPSVDVAITVDGGSGNDRITNRADGTKIKGGSGNDSITSVGDRVSIDGGSGNDSISSVGDRGKILGGDGNDRIRVTGDNNVVRGNGSESFWELLFGSKDKDNVTVSGDGNNTK